MGVLFNRQERERNTISISIPFVISAHPSIDADLMDGRQLDLLPSAYAWRAEMTAA